MEQPTNYPVGAPVYAPPPGPAKPTAAAYFLGFLGALLGALVGAIPWFIVSAFFSFFVGWLGFLVGLASFFGYKLFKGAKNLPFAMVTIIVLSILAICLAEFCGYAVYVYQQLEEVLAAYGVTLPFSTLFPLTIESTFEVLTSPEVIGEAVGNLLIGLVIAVLGIVAVRGQIFAYVQAGAPLYGPESGVPAANPYAPPADPSSAAGVPAEGAAPNMAYPQAGPAAAQAVPAAAPVPQENAGAPAPAAPSVIPTATAGVTGQTITTSGGVPPVAPAPAVAPYGSPAPDGKTEQE